MHNNIRQRRRDQQDNKPLNAFKDDFILLIKKGGKMKKLIVASIALGGILMAGHAMAGEYYAYADFGRLENVNRFSLFLQF